MYYDYSNHTTYDQIAPCRGSGGVPLGQGSHAGIFLEVLQDRFHPASIVCLAGSQNVLQDRLSRSRFLLKDFRELREDLDLKEDKLPHYSTLCKAASRLLKKGRRFS